MHIETLSQDHISRLVEFDTKTFPPSMLITQEDYLEFTSIKDGILAYTEICGVWTGVAFAIPAQALKEDVTENDLSFDPRVDEIYSYSVGVLPSYRGQQMGSHLSLELAREARLRGWRFLSAHVRISEGWAKRRRKILPPITTRIIPDYWDDDRKEPMEYQLVDLHTLP